MFSVLLVSNPSTLLDHTEARKAEKCVFFWDRQHPLSQGLDDLAPLIWRLDPPLITRFRYIEVRLHIHYYYWGEEDRSLYRGLRHIKVRYACSNVIQQIFGNQKILTPHYHDVSRQSIYFHFSCFREFILYHFYKTSYYTN